MRLFPILAFGEVMFLKQRFSWTGVLLLEGAYEAAKLLFSCLVPLHTVRNKNKQQKSKQEPGVLGSGIHQIRLSAQHGALGTTG